MNPSERDKAAHDEAVKTAICLFVVFAGLVLVGPRLWDWYATSRTTTVRAVFLRPADRNTGPQVYLDDGTVWALTDVAESVRMIQGDDVRYVFVSSPAERMDSSSPDTCELKDVTTGYTTEAVRLSAPFKRSSCPSGASEENAETRVSFDSLLIGEIEIWTSDTEPAGRVTPEDSSCPKEYKPIHHVSEDGHINHIDCVPIASQAR